MKSGYVDDPHLRESARHRRASAFPGIFVAMVVAACALDVSAAVTATDAWVRGTVPAQRTTGAFVTLESSDAAKVVGVSSPAARSVEMHASQHRDGVMHMHPVEAVALPAGRRVEFKPGGYHVMLVDLTHPLAAGDRVPLVFTIEDGRGKRTRLEVSAEVRPLGK
jgi:copper(I)-binding protein